MPSPLDRPSSSAPPPQNWFAFIVMKQQVRNGIQVTQAGRDVIKLRLVEVLAGQGITGIDAIRQIQIVEQTVSAGSRI